MMSKLTINSTFSEVRLASDFLQKFCRKHGIAVETQDQLELIVIEALNNVVEHAYQGKSDGNIVLELENLKTNTVIKITDNGIAAPGTVMVEGSELPNEHELPEGGWGLCLIQALADTIEYFRYPDHNTLVMTKSTE